MNEERAQAEAIAKKAKTYLDLCAKNEKEAMAAKKQAFQDWMGAEQKRLEMELREKLGEIPRRDQSNRGE